VMHDNCDSELPGPGQVWGGVVNQVDQWWEELEEAV